MAKSKQKYCTHYDDDFELHEAEIVEQNGNLIYVEDLDTRRGDYVCPHQVDREWEQ